MFPDHENPSNIAGAAATAPSNTEASTPEETAPPIAEQAESTNGVSAARPAPASEISAPGDSAATPNGAEAPGEAVAVGGEAGGRSEEHTSELQSPCKS